MKYRFAQSADLPRLAKLNAQLISDEGHQNPMSVSQLEARMATWLEGDYRAAVFEEAGQVVSHAFWRSLGFREYCVSYELYAPLTPTG